MRTKVVCAALGVCLLFGSHGSMRADCTCAVSPGQPAYDTPFPPNVQSASLSTLSNKNGVCTNDPNCNNEEPKDCTFTVSISLVAKTGETIPFWEAQEGSQGALGWSWVEEPPKASGEDLVNMTQNVQVIADCGQTAGLRVLVGSSDPPTTRVAMIPLTCTPCSG